MRLLAARNFRASHIRWAALIQTGQNVRRDVNLLVVPDDRLVEMLEYGLGISFAEWVTVEPQHQRDVALLAVVLHLLQDLLVDLVVDVRFFTQEPLLLQRKLNFEIGLLLGDLLVQFLELGTGRLVLLKRFDQLIDLIATRRDIRLGNLDRLAHSVLHRLEPLVVLEDVAQVKNGHRLGLSPKSREDQGRHKTCGNEGLFHVSAPSLVRGLPKTKKPRHEVNPAYEPFRNGGLRGADGRRFRGAYLSENPPPGKGQSAAVRELLQPPGTSCFIAPAGGS